MNITSSSPKERSPQPVIHVKEESGSHRPRGGNKSGTTSPSPSSAPEDVSQAEYDNEQGAPRVPSRFHQIPSVKKCCYYIPDLRIATALICVFAISTSPSITWLLVRHSYSVQLTCYLDYENKVLSVGMGLRDIDSTKSPKNNSNAGGNKSDDGGGNKPDDGDGNKSDDGGGNKSDDGGGNKSDDGAGLRINLQASTLYSDTTKSTLSTAKPSTGTENLSTSTTTSKFFTSIPKSVASTSEALSVNSTYQRVQKASYVYSDYQSKGSEERLSFIRLEDTSTSSSSNSGLRIMAWINFLIDLAFVICAIILLTKIFRKPHRKYIIPFMVLALLSTFFSLLYALINFGVSKKEEGRFPICVIFFTTFDVALWLYFIVVVNSYLISIKRPRVHTEETEPTQSWPKD